MGGVNLGPTHEFAKMLSELQSDVQQLKTRDVLQNATFGSDGTTVPQAFANLTTAMNSLVVPQTNAAGAAGLATTTVSTVRASLSFAVPSGYTQALIVAQATAMGQNSTGAQDYIYAQVVLNGTNGGELYSSAAAGISAGVSAPYYSNLTGLAAGSSITVAAASRTGFAAWAASPSNATNIYAQVIFLR